MLVRNEISAKLIHGSDTDWDELWDEGIYAISIAGGGVIRGMVCFLPPQAGIPAALLLVACIRFPSLICSVRFSNVLGSQLQPSSVHMLPNSLSCLPARETRMFPVNYIGMQLAALITP